MTEVKQIDDELYDVICGWWRDHGWPVLPKELLPKHGYIVVLDGRPVIAGFLYKDVTASFGMIEWIVADPKSTRDDRDKCFPSLIEKLLSSATECGVKLLVTTAIHKSLIGRLEKSGFVIDYDGITQLCKQL